jgi:hypothetical protein
MASQDHVSELAQSLKPAWVELVAAVRPLAGLLAAGVIFAGIYGGFSWLTSGGPAAQRDTWGEKLAEERATKTLTADAGAAIVQAGYRCPRVAEIGERWTSNMPDAKRFKVSCGSDSSGYWFYDVTVAELGVITGVNPL